MGKGRIIGLVLGVLLLIFAAGWYGVQYFNYRPQTVAVDNATKEEVGKLNLKGDQTIAAQYASALKDNDTKRAEKVFSDAVASTDDQKQKLALWSQNISLALAYEQQDSALKAALAAINLQPSFATYNDAYRVYTVAGDHAKQKEMLQKAIDALKTSDVANEEQLLAVMTQQMNEVNQQMTPAGSK